MSADREMTLAERIATAFEYRIAYPIRLRRERAIERHGPRAAERLYRISDRVARLPFRRERTPRPEPRRVGGLAIDAMDDLAAYTQLSRDTLSRLVERREPTSFRSEWYSTPPEMRGSHWFHLASSAYLFGNASHFPDDQFAEHWVLPHVGNGGAVLDFGAGTGELALQLAGRGVRVCAVELNALQRDFLRFRVDRHGLSDAIEVADWWRPLPEGAFDVAVAIDVLEHLDDCQAVLEERILPALKPTGVLVEDSPFVMNTSNPMHHVDFGLVPYLTAKSFAEIASSEGGARAWRRTGGQAEGAPGVPPEPGVHR